jgi:PKD repeat protein
MHTFHLKSNKGRTFLILMLLFPLFAQSQRSSCANSDFSDGTFANWVGFTSVYPYDTPGTNIGTPQSPYPSPPYYYNMGLVPGRHTIITTATSDPITCGNVMTLPPGEKQCVRLGNGGKGTWGNGIEWQREFLEYNFSITPRNSLVIYKYAAVLQDPVPHHDKSIKPRFIVSVINSQGKITDSLCGINAVFADSSALFHVCDQRIADSLGANIENEGNIIYTDWTTVAVDLRGYIGQNIKLRFETWDCGLGGHFGYAYLTAKCQEMKITANACIPGGIVTLRAPEGFTYKWLPSGQVTQSITITNAKAGDSAYVELTSVNGCKTFLKKFLFQDFPTADFDIDSMVCAGIPVHFTDKSGGDNEHWDWDFGDGSTDTIQNPVHIYSTKGIYSVRLAVRTADACTDSVATSLYICPGTAINDIEQLLIAHVYPNPSSGLFKLEIDPSTKGTIQVEISDLLGRIVYSEKNIVKNGLLQKDLDIKAQPDGIYFLTIKSAECSKVMKLIKKS